MGEIQTADDDRVRDHLANERTYLAWLRTGVSTIGFAIVIAKLRNLFPEHSPPIGLILSFIGLGTVLAALFRFLRVRLDIRQHKYQSDIVFPMSLALVIVIVGIIILWFLRDAP